MIKVGVIGFGNSARTFHIPFITTLDSLELVAISSSKKELVAEKHPQVSIFETAHDLILNGNLELVIITAPNNVHYELAKLCLENGINVVLEKPMVTTSLEAQELVALAKERSLLLSVFHNRRWDGDFLTVKKLLENKKIGDVRLFESHFDRFRPVVANRWRDQKGAGSGIWFDLGSHLVDQAVCLFGLPQSITARCLLLREGAEAPDYFHVLLHYDNLEVILHASSFSAGPNNRFRVEGTKGTFIKQGLDPQEDQLKRGMTPNDASYGVDAPADCGTVYGEASCEFIETENGCYQQYYLGIIDAIKSAGPNPVDPAGVVDVLRILELSEKSSETGKTISLS